MAKTATFSYVSERKGKNTQHGKIVVCPRCGRKGAHRMLAYKLGSVIADVIHGGYYEFMFWTIDDRCGLNEQENAAIGKPQARV